MSFSPFYPGCKSVHRLPMCTWMDCCVRVFISVLCLLSFVADAQQSEIVTEQPLIENVNRLQFEGEEARSVDEAIRMLRYYRIDSCAYLVLIKATGVNLL